MRGRLWAKAEKAMGYDGAFRPDLDWRAARATGFNLLAGPFEIAPLSDGVWRFRLQMDERHVNFGGVCHGGVLFTLLDYAMGIAATAASADRLASTVSMNTHFIASAKPGSFLHGEAVVVRATRDVCFLEAEVWGGDRLAAKASAVFKYLNVPKPAGSAGSDRG